MIPFTIVTSMAAPLPRDNVDTDTIIPSREMRGTGRTGLADGLFAPWRYRDVDARLPNPAFVLNQPRFVDAQILVSGANFGCGSSREHAVWALGEWGIRVVVAASFAPIFTQNCLRNGVLPVVATDTARAAIADTEVTIDLARQTIASGALCWHFAIGEEDKAMLLEGIDAIDLTLKSLPAIDAWTQTDRTARPWVYLP